MVSPNTSLQETPRSSIDAPSSPRISFSDDLLDERNFISITPHSPKMKDHEPEKDRTRNADFEFLSSNLSCQTTMITADELFYEGKLLPFWQIHNAEKLSKISLKTDPIIIKGGKLDSTNKDDYKMSWFHDDDPSPRPPKCTVLWKELLKLRKHKSSTLSPSSSSSSSSSSNLGEAVPTCEKKEGSQGNKEKNVKKVKKGLERTKSATIRIRPVVNVPICTQGKNNHGLPPLFPFRKGRLERNDISFNKCEPYENALHGKIITLAQSWHKARGKDWNKQGVTLVNRNVCMPTQNFYKTTSFLSNNCSGRCTKENTKIYIGFSGNTNPIQEKGGNIRIFDYLGYYSGNHGHQPWKSSDGSHHDLHRSS